MNSNTGAIATFESDTDARKAGYRIPLTAQEAAGLAEKTRLQRLSWVYLQQKDNPNRFRVRPKRTR